VYFWGFLKDIEESIELNGYANVFEDEVSDLVLSQVGPVFSSMEQPW
jgi:hypothetical protein